jgi:hypothetical protein
MLHSYRFATVRFECRAFDKPASLDQNKRTTQHVVIQFVEGLPSLKYISFLNSHNEKLSEHFSRVSVILNQHIDHALKETEK